MGDLQFALTPMPRTENELLVCPCGLSMVYTVVYWQELEVPGAPECTRLSDSLPTILFSHPSTFEETSYLGNAVHVHLIGL